MRVKTVLIGEEENNENGRRRSSAAQYMERERARFDSDKRNEVVQELT